MLPVSIFVPSTHIAVRPHVAERANTDALSNHCGSIHHSRGVYVCLLGLVGLLPAISLHELSHGRVRVIHTNQTSSILHGCSRDKVFGDQNGTGSSGVQVSFIRQIGQKRQVALGCILNTGKSSECLSGDIVQLAIE